MTDTKHILTTIIAITITLTGFLAVLMNIPIEATISRENAISVIKANAKVDPTKQIVKDEFLRSAELRYMAIHWENYLQLTGYHRRIYVSTTPVGDMAPYWIIDYQDTRDWHYAPAGSYIVDARTGELMLVLEDTGGPPQESDYSITFSPDDSLTTLSIKPGETKVITVMLTAQPTYDASLPVHFEATGVPDFITVEQNATSAILRTGEAVSFEIRVSVSSRVYDSNMEPHIEIWATLSGSGIGRVITIILQK